MSKILAIDDNNDNLISLKAIIDDAFPDSILYTALSGAKGIELAIETIPDVILLDIIMPAMDGFEVCRLLKLDERVRDIPVVFLTALKGDKENRIKALEVGAEGFLSKPIDEIELIAQIRAMVKIKAANEQKRDEKASLEKLVEQRTNELLQSQAMLKGIFENLQDAYFRADLNGKFTLISPSAITMYGYNSIDELIGQRAEILYYDPTERVSLFSKLRGEGKVLDFVARGKKKDGTAFWVSMNVRLLYSDDGRVNGSEGVVRDISERVNSERALKESEERFRHISSSISDISYSCETDLNGNSTINWLYGAVEEITGYTLEEVVATKCWGKLVLDEDFPIFNSCILGVVPGQSKSCQLRLKKKDGSLVWIQATSECVKGTNDKGLNLIYGGLVDISDRKLAEQSLQKSEAQFREFFEKAADAIFIAEIETGIVVDANESASRLMQRPHDELVGIHQTELHPLVKKSYTNDTFDKHKEQVKNKLKSNAVENCVVRADGIEVPVEIMASEVVFQGKPCLMGTFRDITERKRAEDELRENVDRLELAMSTANMSWWEVDLATGQVVFEKRKAVMLGYAPEKFKHYTDFTALVHPEDYERTMDAMRLHLKGLQDKYEIEYRIKSISGEYKWFYDLGSVTKRDSEGKPLIVSGLVLNISERKLADEALKNSLSLTEATLESIHNGILVVDQGGRVVITNSRFAEMWNIPKNIFASGDDKILINIILDQLANPDEFVSRVMELYSKPELESTDFVYFKDGRIFERVSKPMCLDGKPKGRVWSFLDITERMKAEEALKESQSLYYSLIEQLPNPVFRKDREGRFILVNSQFCKLKGLSSEHFIGLTASEVAANEIAVRGKLGYATQYFAQGEDVHVQILQTGKTIEKEEEYIFDDGSRQYLHVVRMPVVDSSGNIIGTQGIMFDITERKLMENALQESEYFFKESQRAAFVGSYKFDIVADHWNSSEVLDKIFGIDKNFDRSIQGWTKITHPDDQEMMAQYFIEDVIGKQQSFNKEYRIIRLSDGMTRWVLGLGKLNFDAEGKATEMIGTIQDITDRKLAEVSLKESEDRYRQFVSQVSEGVYRLECDEPMDVNLPEEQQIDYIYDHMFLAECNESFLKMYGEGSQSEMMGNDHLFFHGSKNNPSNREGLRNFIRNGYRIENSTSEEFNSISQVVYFSNNALGIIENNHLIRMWGTQIDITEKIKADKVQHVLYTISNATLSTVDLPELIEIISIELGKLLDSTNFFIAFYDEQTNMLSTIYEKDEKDVMQTWSAEKSMTGYVIRNQKSILIHEPEVRQLIDSGELENFGTPSKVWLGVPLKLNKKVIGAIVVQSYDNPEAFNEKDKLMLEFISHQICISIERKKAEQELNKALVKARESDRLKSAFLANMSHEIRTPLNSIIGFSDLLLDPEFDEGQKKSFAENISQSGNGLLAIISDIMDLSKIETGQVQVNKSNFSINRLIRDIQREYSFRTTEKGIELELDPLNPKEDIIVESDQNKLRQVLINFVGNALKFTDKGFIEMGIRDQGESVYVQVKDTGIGIPEEYHDKVFERFRQVESAESRKYGGNGLGLAISKSLIEILGGEIGVESAYGKGSTFYFTIPKKNSN